ncbi:ArnT family glycosyltransferase [Ktedonosporobacter rubrisoli]|nr:glycosyltransferase family 39 protein [Ktedonosporobacter rubrisoli]
MAANTIVHNNTKRENETTVRRFLGWQTALFCLVLLALLLLGILMRLHDLGLPFDRDSYDEGVYWQSLRAMSAGHALYQSIFYSQPPFFMFSIFPTYLFSGQSLWAARLGIALVSMLGLLGAFLLGKALSGRVGAIAALLLIIVDPLYLAQSQTIQAEAPSTALSLLAIGAAYLWWEHPEGVAGICYAIVAALTLSLSIFCKLLAVSTLVPIGLLMLAHIWRMRSGKHIMGLDALLLGISVFLACSALLIVPFMNSLPQAWQGVVTFHTTAGSILKSSQPSNAKQLEHLLITLTSCAALFGTLAALLRRDWRVVPLLAWFLVTVYLLWQQTPLFPHHLVALTPPLVGLAVIGIGPLPLSKQRPAVLINIATGISLLLILVTAVLNGQADQHYYYAMRQQNAAGATQQQLQVAKDLQSVTRPDQLVVTDAQFLAALANRSTPAPLVDTSLVRIQTGYLTAQQLIQQVQQPEVHAVLFYTGRINASNVSAFRQWVTHHLHRVHSYGNGKELWIK